MIDWIREHSSILNTMATFATLLLWIFYAQLLCIRRDDNRNVSLHPASTDTNRMTSIRHRRQLRSWLRDYL